jgi:hypothetical protein
MLILVLVHVRVLFEIAYFYLVRPVPSTSATTPFIELKLPISIMAERLTLWCLLEVDQEIQDTFPVEISGRANIHDLKEEIFPSLDAIELAGVLLYKVCHSSIRLLHSVNNCHYITIGPSTRRLWS